MDDYSEEFGERLIKAKEAWKAEVKEMLDDDAILILGEIHPENWRVLRHWMFVRIDSM